jgi:hypothetical protein
MVVRIVVVVAAAAVVTSQYQIGFGDKRHRSSFSEEPVVSMFAKYINDSREYYYHQRWGIIEDSSQSNRKAPSANVTLKSIQPHTREIISIDSREANYGQKGSLFFLSSAQVMQTAQHKLNQPITVFNNSTSITYNKLTSTLPPLSTASSPHLKSLTLLLSPPALTSSKSKGEGTVSCSGNNDDDEGDNPWWSSLWSAMGEGGMPAIGLGTFISIMSFD